MAKFYMIRHGKPDYSYGDARGFIGHGHDLAPLLNDKIGTVKLMAKDARLKEASVLISSPITRALQTAAIISKEIDLDIVVESDLIEWQPDLTYQYKNVDEMKLLYNDFLNNNGLYPVGQKKKWEQLIDVQKRTLSVLEKYKKYDAVIVVAHNIVINSVCNCGHLKCAEIYEFEF